MHIIAENHIWNQPPAEMRSVSKLFGNAHSVSTPLELGVTEPHTSPAFSFDATAGTTGEVKMPRIESPDWDNEKQHIKFGDLERKVLNKLANQEEQTRYLSLLASRCAWVASHGYLARYIEDEKQKALLQKLEEIRELLKPCKVAP